MSALAIIAATLRKLADDLEQPDYRADPFEVRHIARQIEAQNEMQERGIAA
jgi:hypothetical protein